MFTGLIQEKGHLQADPQPSEQGGVRLVIGHSRHLGERLTLGASLSVSGVCLTVIEQEPEASEVELSPETLRRSRLGSLRAGDRLNLEAALRMGDPLGGHWVQGHVDGLTRVGERRDLAQHRELAFHLPAEHRGHVIEKGSVAIDGVSLTVSTLEDERFWVALIPHTLEVTTLGDLQPDDEVHLELDVLAKYVRRALTVAEIVPGRETP